LKIKTTREEVQYSQSAVNCSSWNGHSDWEPARRLVDDSWAGRRQGWPTPTEIDVSVGDRRLIDVSSVSTHRRLGLGGREQHGDWLRNTSWTVGVVRRKKTTKLWQL